MENIIVASDIRGCLIFITTKIHCDPYRHNTNYDHAHTLIHKTTHTLQTSPDTSEQWQTTTWNICCTDNIEWLIYNFAGKLLFDLNFKFELIWNCCFAIC